MKGLPAPSYCTPATKDLSAILLPDSGYLQEEEARYANLRGHSKHNPALPLYTKEEAEQSLDSFREVPWGSPVKLGYPHANDRHNELTFEFHPAGHILGAASVVVSIGETRVLFSGDLGRKNDPITRIPRCNVTSDILVVESTYGNRQHIECDPQAEICKTVLATYRRGGTLLIPSFAVGRAQLLLYYLYKLKRAGSIPDIPIYLNSPMALKANESFCRHFDESKLSRTKAEDIFSIATPVTSTEDSKRLQTEPTPKIVIAASGMATGGRVLHHLKSLAPDPKNTFLFCGFQTGGTGGEALTQGAPAVKIFGEMIPIRADVIRLDSLSAHADGGEILDWIEELAAIPPRIYVTHGEPAAAEELKNRISERFKVQVRAPEYFETVKI